MLWFIHADLYINIVGVVMETSNILWWVWDYEIENFHFAAVCIVELKVLYLTILVVVLL